MKHILEGRTINSIALAEDAMAILFRTDKGDVVAQADGDCCSHTWIESVSMPARGFPAHVLKVDHLDMPDLGGGDEWSEIAYYGLKIVTNQGDIIIDYRNESNGYYGGNLWFPKEDPDEYNYYYGGVFGQNVSEQKWVELA